MKLLPVQVHCSESTQQWWTNETLSIKQQLLFIATQCCRLNCRDTHRCTKVFNANARSFVRKCAHCLKWRWSSPGSGSRCTIAVFVHHWCTIAVATVHFCTIMLSQRCNIALSRSYHIVMMSQSCASHYLQQSLHCHSRNYSRWHKVCVDPFLNGLYFSEVQCPLH